MFPRVRCALLLLLLVPFPARAGVRVEPHMGGLDRTILWWFYLRSSSESEVPVRDQSWHITDEK